MSTITKVFVLLVSLLAIFLCGVVVTFVSSTPNWKKAYETQKTVAEAAQVQAQVAEIEAQRAKSRYEQSIDKLTATNEMLLARIAELNRDLSSERLARAEAESKVGSMVALSESVQQTNQNLYSVERSLQQDLSAAYRSKTSAEAQVIAVTRSLENERAKTDHLEAIRQRKVEELHALEQENEKIRQQLSEVTLAPKDFQAAGDQVAQRSVAPAGVPIRGEITGVDGSGRASISVGSASGVREGTIFQVVRGGRYVGSLEIRMVESTQAAGRLRNIQGVIVPGDKVTTGFD